MRDLKRESDLRGLLLSGRRRRGRRASHPLPRRSQRRRGLGPEAASRCGRRAPCRLALSEHCAKDENELIAPARDGALRVLGAARDAGVKRVVLTSSFAAIGYGAPKDRTSVFTEEDWTNPGDPTVQAYAKSKTFAERAAWDFIAREGGKLELAVVNPVGVFGPVLGPDLSTSIVLVKRLLDGSLPGLPPISGSAESMCATSPICTLRR